MTTAMGDPGQRQQLQLGLFDIMQVDPIDPATTAAVYQQRLDDLALADELGFAVAFTAERHFMPTYRAPAPTAWLGAASQRTKTMRLGALAYTLPIANPVRLAEEIAVLDQLTQGRLEVGFGLGHRPEELIAFGVDPARRVPIYQERLAILRALWTGGSVSLESDHDTLREVAIHPLPVQAPHPPIWHAGTEPVAAHWVGNQGFGLAVGFLPTEKLMPAVTAFLSGRRIWHESQAEAERAAPPRPCGSLALMRHVYLAESDERAMREITDDLLRLNTPSESGAGSRADRRAAASQQAAQLVRDEVMIAGGPETVAAAIAQSRQQLQIDLFLANVYAAGVETARIHRALHLLATEVRPRANALLREPSAVG